MEILTPEQLAQEGQKKYQNGDYLAAAQSFEGAASGYRDQDDPLNAAEMENNRSVALLQAKDAPGALQAALDTDKVFAAAGDKRRQALALGNQAAALAALNRLDEAEAAYIQSGDLLKELGETDLRASVMQSLSQIQLRTGRQLEALATMQAGVTGVKKPSLRQRFLKRLLEIPSKFLNRS